MPLRLYIVELGLYELAGGQKRPRLLRGRRFAMNWPEPAEPHELGDAARIVPVRLYRHRFEGVADMPRLEQLRCEPRVLQARVKPLR